MEKQSIWSAAALPGIILGAVSIAYLLICHFCGNISSPILQSLLTVLLWVAKFGGSLYLLYWFTKRYTLELDEAAPADAFKFGMVLALLSAFVYSAFYFVYAQFIAPDIFEAGFDMINESYSQYMDQAAIDEILNMKPDFPKMLFVVNLVYCWLFGTVASSFFARSIVPSNPFKQN